MNDFYAAVFGAGISGNAIANSLVKRGKNVLLIDPFVSEEAPGAPAALVNPATGRHARLSWKSRECMSSLKNHIDELNRETGKNDLVSFSGVIRPAITEKLAENFKVSLEKYDWPAGWIRWIEPEDVRNLNPEIAPNYGGLFVDAGFTVFVDRYQNVYRRYLRKKGVECRYEAARYLHDASSGRFTVQFESGEKMSAEHVIVAAGHRTPGFEDWNYLPLHRVKGQIVTFKTKKELNWNHAVSAMGYTLRTGKKELVTGSTYEHKFTGLETTEHAYHLIRKKLAKMLPGIAKNAERKGQMAGVRVTTPNKLPVIGRHKEKKNLCIYTAMGSKGLLFSEYVGAILADHLVNQAPVPPDLDTVRFH